MSEIWLSVAMTTYNASEFLADALESVAAQSGPDIEVIAVDDGSEDDTLEILESYRSRMNLRILALEHTGNWIASMNLGLREARGEYTCFLHHDDHWLAGRVDAVRAALAAAPETILLVHPSRFVDRRGERLGDWGCGLASRRHLTPEAVLERLLVQNTIAVPAPVFRTDAATAVGGLDDTLWHSADWDFWLKLAALGETTYLDRTLVGYRIHPIAATWQGTGRADQYRWQMDAVVDRHMAELESRQPPRPGLRRAARFSVEVNTRLAAFAHGHRPRLAGLVAMFFAMGPSGCLRYVRDSRIVDRVGARVAAGMLRWPVPGSQRPAYG